MFEFMFIGRELNDIIWVTAYPDQPGDQENIPSLQ